MFSDEEGGEKTSAGVAAAAKKAEAVKAKAGEKTEAGAVETEGATSGAAAAKKKNVQKTPEKMGQSSPSASVVMVVVLR